MPSLSADEDLALEQELEAIRAELESVRADAAAAAAREAEAAATFEALDRELEALEARRAEALAAERVAGPERAGAPTAVAIEPVPATALRLRANSNLRAGPGMNQPVRATLSAGTVVEGFAAVGDWTRVGLADGRGGWIYSALLARDPARSP